MQTEFIMGGIQREKKIVSNYFFFFLWRRVWPGGG